MSKALPLKSLTLTAFRGSSGTFKLDFEKGRKLSLIYGENGTGKTTICDALEFLAREKIGSLEDRGMGKGLEQYWHSAGKSSKDLFVRLDAQGETCSGKIVSKKVSITPATAKPRIELLRQKQILDLIGARPAERYEAIKRFIDIAEFEQSEETLRQLSKSLTLEETEAQNSELESLAVLQSYFEIAGNPAGENPVSWAKKKLTTPPTGLDADISAIEKFRSVYAALKAFAQTAKERDDAAEAAKTALAKSEAALSVALSSACAGAEEMLGILEAGDAYLHKHPDASECPLCSSKENAAGLADAIKHRLTALETLKQANVERKKRQTAMAQAEAAQKQTAVEYAKAAAAFESGKSGHSWKPEVRLPSSPTPSQLSDLPEWLTASASAADTWPTTEASWRDEKKFVATLKAALDRYETNLNRRVELTALVPNVEKALELCVAERQKFTDGIISEIATDVGKLYEVVHPTEGLDAISLPLDPAKRASIELKAKFAGQDAFPQAYFSQSHLDTLGLCVFLALAMREKADETILILDDVLGSVDEPHVARVIGLIYDVSAKFRHTIVTTHYRPWREKYRWGWLKPGQPCQFIELTGWTIQDGMRVISSLPEIDRLKALLAEAPIDPQAICSKAGVILEAVLDYLTQKYECAVPRRREGAYTVGDLLPAISGKLRDSLKVEIRSGTDPTAPAVSEVALKPILDEITKIAQARNVFGAHFKAISFEMLDTDAVAFAKQVEALVDALTHPNHGWPSNDNSGSYWRNSGDTRRLHPLKKPS